MERADLRVLPVAVTVDHSLTRESMKDCQCHVKDFLLSSPYRLVSSHLRRYREGRAGTGMRKVCCSGRGRIERGRIERGEREYARTTAMLALFVMVPAKEAVVVRVQVSSGFVGFFITIVKLEREADRQPEQPDADSQNSQHRLTSLENIAGAL